MTQVKGKSNDRRVERHLEDEMNENENENELSLDEAERRLLRFFVNRFKAGYSYASSVKHVLDGQTDWYLLFGGHVSLDTFNAAVGRVEPNWKEWA